MNTHTLRLKHSLSVLNVFCYMCICGIHIYIYVYVYIYIYTHDGQKWSLPQCGVCKTPGQKQQKTEEIACLEADMKDATQRFLDGLDSDESDDGTEFECLRSYRTTELPIVVLHCFTQYIQNWNWKPSGIGLAPKCLHGCRGRGLPSFRTWLFFPGPRVALGAVVKGCPCTRGKSVRAASTKFAKSRIWRGNRTARQTQESG